MAGKTEKIDDYERRGEGEEKYSEARNRDA